MSRARRTVSRSLFRAAGPNRRNLKGVRSKARSLHPQTYCAQFAQHVTVVAALDSAPFLA
jgi:hypothetical protein